ncbi:hypothetical protein [Streptococcus gallolyticus]|uniref:Uncharacterized protein n=1 Tax=Streptococcus gallolyticus TaxID=315405 RepID=A0A139R3D5_9STRE|nr:hypothetical protein [Streptococcus gallolyticus]KXT67242.1 hypothetical protein SGADD02_01472 [Streptococcus gallolyticus]KXU09196.1 hypothetical protein SGADD03_00980 [Streptococcus gallolyticus]
MSNLFAVFGLGLAGIDPVGLFVLMAAMTAGLSRQKAIQFGLFVLLGTVFLGVSVSLLVGTSLSRLSGYVNNLSNNTWIVIDFALVLGLGGLGLYRLLVKSKKSNREDSQKTFKSIYVAAIFMIFTALTDATFLAVLALSAREDSIILSTIYTFLWTLISQSPLFFLVGAVVFNKHKNVIPKFTTFYDRYRLQFQKALSYFLIILAFIFVVDLYVYFTSGIWLIG